MANNNRHNGLLAQAEYMMQNASLHSVRPGVGETNLRDGSQYLEGQTDLCSSSNRKIPSLPPQVNPMLVAKSPSVSSVTTQETNQFSGSQIREQQNILSSNIPPSLNRYPQFTIQPVMDKSNESNGPVINSVHNVNTNFNSTSVCSQMSNENTKHSTSMSTMLAQPKSSPVTLDNKHESVLSTSQIQHINMSKPTNSFQQNFSPKNMSVAGRQSNSIGPPRSTVQPNFQTPSPQEGSNVYQGHSNHNIPSQATKFTSSSYENHPTNAVQTPSHSYQMPPTMQQTSGLVEQQKHNRLSNRYPPLNNLWQQKQQSPMLNQNQPFQEIPHNQYNQYNQQPTLQNKPQPTPSQQQSVFQQPSYPGYQPCVTSMGFNKLWGNENFDLLQHSDILPAAKLTAPKIVLGQEILDNANCSPDIFRCTMTKIPESNTLLQKSRLPLGILIHPFRDLSHLPVIQCNVIVRCRACRTYINPFVYFVDNKRWKCNLCYRINELPEEFQYDPISKTYGDPSRRPEVRASTIEYIAPAEYMLRPPQPAVYLFLLDISRTAIESGYLHTVCSVLLEELKNIPGDARTQIGFLAYDSSLHFFSLAEGLSQPREMTVLEIDDVFLPCPDNLLVNLKDNMDMVIDLLNQLPTRYTNSFDNSSALGAALQAAHKMMSPTGGRVTVFQCLLPNVGPGSLAARGNSNQKSSVDVALINPANDFYKRLSLDCSAQQIAIDMFILNAEFVDIATISGISRFSGGCIYHFPTFHVARPVQNGGLEQSFRRYLTRKIGFEAVMRIRCSRGLSIHTFHGNFFVRSTDLLSLPNVNPDAGFGMQVAIDDNLSDIHTVCFQAALLYTSSKGERRIRVHTLCMPVTSILHEVINSADQQCVIGLLAKMAVDRSMQSNLSDAREAFVNVAVDILSSYRMSLNLGDGQSGLLAPDCLKLLPLYISALLKSQAFRTGAVRLDDRVKTMLDMKTKPLYQLIQQIYPDMYPIHKLEEQQMFVNSEEEPVPMPPHLQLTARCLETRGAFLMDLGEHMIIYVCSGVSETFITQTLGVANFNSIPEDMCELPVLENTHSKRLHLFVNHLNEEKPFTATLQVIKDTSPDRILFLEKLIEDRHENALSYHEFLQHIKSQVK